MGKWDYKMDYAVILITFRANAKCHGFSFLLNRAVVNSRIRQCLNFAMLLFVYT